MQTCEWKRIKQPQAEARPNEKSNLLHSDGRWWSNRDAAWLLDSSLLDASPSNYSHFHIPIIITIICGYFCAIRQVRPQLHDFERNSRRKKWNEFEKITNWTIYELENTKRISIVSSEMGKGSQKGTNSKMSEGMKWWKIMSTWGKRQEGEKKSLWSRDTETLTLRGRMTITDTSTGTFTCRNEEGNDRWRNRNKETDN